MPTLGNFQGQSLNVNLGRSIGQGLGIQSEMQRQQLIEDKRRQIEAQAQADAQNQARFNELAGLGQPTQSSAGLGGSVPEMATPGFAPPGMAQPDLDRLAIEFPQEAKKIFDAQSQRDKQKIESVVVGAAQALASPNPVEFLTNRRQDLVRQGLPTDETDEVLAMYQAGDIAGAENTLSEVANLGQQLGILEAPAGQDMTSLQQNAQAAGYTPGTPEYQEFIRNKMSGVLSPEALAQKQQLAQAGGTKINIGEDGMTPEQKIQLAAESKKAEKLAEVRAKGIAERESLDIASGSEAARSVPNLQRSIDLLASIETGGIDAAILKGKQALGIESADEAELVNALNQQVLAQLKPIFGAQFTKAEGDWLKDIEAGPSKSTEGNIRLLERGLKLAKRRAEIGLKAAESAKDYRSAAEIQEFLDMDLTPDQPKKIGRFTVEPE